jgi:hypothetical protein
MRRSLCSLAPLLLASVDAAFGTVLALRTENGTSVQPVWLYPDQAWEKEGAGKQAEVPVARPDLKAACANANMERLFFVQTGTSGPDSLSLGVFHAQHPQRIEISEFKDARSVVHMGYSGPALDALALLAAGEQGTDCGPSVPPELRLMAEHGEPKVVYTYPKGFECVSKFSSSFVDESSGTHWAMLLASGQSADADPQWTLFGVDLAAGTLVQRPKPVTRVTAGACSADTCKQAPLSFAFSRAANRAFGLDVDARDAAGSPGLQVAELDTQAATIKLSSAVPAGATRTSASAGFDMSMLASSAVPGMPGDEMYFAYLNYVDARSGSGAAPVATMFAVNLTDWTLASSGHPWAGAGGRSGVVAAQWLPAQP